MSPDTLSTGHAARAWVPDPGGRKTKNPCLLPDDPALTHSSQRKRKATGKGDRKQLPLFLLTLRRCPVGCPEIPDKEVSQGVALRIWVQKWRMLGKLPRPPRPFSHPSRGSPGWAGFWWVFPRHGSASPLDTPCVLNPKSDGKRPG